MCKHIANVQFAFQAPCCGRWFDCSECHFELSDHRLAIAAELAMLCRACEAPFRKDLAALGVEDEACPHCGVALAVPVPVPARRRHPPEHPAEPSSTTSASASTKPPSSTTSE